MSRVTAYNTVCMNEQLQRYRINDSKIVYEDYDDEIVLINLENGNYYSISGAAPVMWRLITEGRHTDGIVDGIMGKYVGARENIAWVTGEFIKGLLDEGLVLRDDGAASATVTPQPAKAGAVAKVPFDPPVLKRYTDMQELILLDPVHEVDESGWPEKKEATEEPEE
jgi:hypothetical protein